MNFSDEIEFFSFLNIHGDQVVQARIIITAEIAIVRESNDIEYSRKIIKSGKDVTRRMIEDEIIKAADEIRNERT